MCADWASESGHWYDAATGEPRYRIIGANGKERDTTVRDAREHGYVPSVTTITGQVMAYALRRWQAEQLLLAGLTLPRQDGEAEADWIKRVWADSQEQAKKAAARGTEIHAAVEAYYANRAFDSSLKLWVDAIISLIEREFGPKEWRAEKSFAHPLGYGGKVDLHSADVLLDFKGKDGDKKWQTYPEHAMQLAAYAHGLGLIIRGAVVWPNVAKWPACGIIFFDRAKPYAEFHEVKAEALERGWRKFEALLKFWQADNL